MAESPRTPGFRPGIYIFKDAGIVDFAAPYDVFSQKACELYREDREIAPATAASR